MKKINFSEPLLWGFDVNFGRGYGASGIFLASKEILEIFFKKEVTVDFGEISGKYSEVSVELSINDFTLLESSRKLTLKEREEYVSGEDPLYTFLSYFEDLEDDEVEDFIENNNLKITVEELYLILKEHL